jgi:hypothetical protein
MEDRLALKSKTRTLPVAFLGMQWIFSVIACIHFEITQSKNYIIGIDSEISCFLEEAAENDAETEFNKENYLPSTTVTGQDVNRRDQTDMLKL